MRDENAQAAIIAYIIIAVLALLGNSLVCVLFVKNRVLLKKSYNVFLVALAVTDLLTAVNLLTASSLVLSGIFPTKIGHLGNEIFCRVICSGWIVFTLCEVSTYICLVLTYKRWCAVVKPLTYQANFSKKRVAVTVALFWVVGLLCTSPRLFEVTMSYNTGDFCCSWRTMTAVKRHYIAVIKATFSVIIPFCWMIGIYSHMLYRTRLRKNRILPADRAHRIRQGRTRMVRLAVIAMILLWMPYQMFCVLALFGLTELNATVYHWTTALAFFNSCINPFIYGVTNHTYRRGYCEIALGCCPVSVHGFLSRHLPLSQTHHAAILVQAVHGRFRPLSAPHRFRQSVMLELNP